MIGYKKITLNGRQSLTDIAVQEYGGVEGLFLLFEDNDFLTDIANVPPAGAKMLIRTTVPYLTAQNKVVKAEYMNNDTVVTTAEKSNMRTGEYVTVGYWANGYTE